MSRFLFISLSLTQARPPFWNPSRELSNRSPRSRNHADRGCALDDDYQEGIGTRESRTWQVGSTTGGRNIEGMRRDPIGFLGCALSVGGVADWFWNTGASPRLHYTGLSPKRLEFSGFQFFLRNFGGFFFSIF